MPLMWSTSLRSSRRAVVTSSPPHISQAPFLFNAVWRPSFEGVHQGDRATVETDLTRVAGVVHGRSSELDYDTSAGLRVALVETTA